MCGFSSENRVAKSMFKPTANGTNPRIVAEAVSNTGVIRVLPASIMAPLSVAPCSRSKSVNSTSKIPFLTTMPTNATIPIPVITTEKSMSKMANPSNTPMSDKKISLKIKSGLLIELNWVTRMIKIKANEASIALPKNAPVSACCSCSPVITIWISEGLSKDSMAEFTWETTSLGW